MTTLAELITLRNGLDAQIAEAKELTRAEGVAKARAILDAYAINVSDLLPKRTKATSTVAVKYRRNGDTWTGRGKQPVWLRDAIAAGAALEHFRVEG